MLTPAIAELWEQDGTGGSVRQRLYRVLRLAIIRMQFAPGQALSEKEISDAFAVSRQPVREAFIRLSEAGLVEVKPQRGTYVVGISQKSVLEARFVREAIEVAVSISAAEQGVSPRVLDELRDLIERQLRCAHGGQYDQFFILDEAFHRVLSLGAGHETAWRVTEEVKAQLDRVRYLSVPDTTPLEKLVQQHADIVDAIERQDVEQARQAMYVHQREILISLPQMVQRFSSIFEDADH
ncbi:GntR family transcriptional regulator [Halomonas smyrnensis]|uniref:GntR family transcriptional regulator n=1 Tax=Halomonas smyrnensis TaxID=720605 RepID=UPI0002E53ECD|nr:GntR family transcriptional regulator [Halomonas smyrnensis]